MKDDRRCPRCFILSLLLKRAKGLSFYYYFYCCCGYKSKTIFIGEVKDCFYCGGKIDLEVEPFIYSDDEHDEARQVCCFGCGLTGPWALSKIVAIEKWNKLYRECSSQEYWDRTKKIKAKVLEKIYDKKRGLQ